MSRRSCFRGPWLGLAVLWGCLNPQPDTGPLRQGPSADNVPGAVIDVSPPSESAPTTSVPAEGAGGDPPSRPGSTPTSANPDDPAPDAGAPPDAGGQTPLITTFSANDAGGLDPDAGVPPSASGDD